MPENKPEHQMEISRDSHYNDLSGTVEILKFNEPTHVVSMQVSITCN